MQETLERVTVYTRDIWRYRWYGVAAAWLVVLVGWTAVSLRPIVYTASAKIYVDTYTVLQPLLKGLAIEPDTGAYLDLMVRQLVSRPNLEQVAHIVGLDRQVETPQQLAGLLNSMERKVKVKGERANRRNNQRDFYTISYPSTDPILAKQVVESLITIFAEKTVEESRRESEAAQRFLAQQIKQQGEKLIAADARIRAFKRENATTLPEQGVNFFQRLQAAQTAVSEVELQIVEARHRRDELQRQLASIPATQRAVSANGSPVLTPEQSRLMALESRLDELLLKFTEEHPDVIATRRSIAQLSNHQVSTSNFTTPNPIYQQLQVALSQIEGEISALLARKEEYLRRLQRLEEQTETFTEVEAQLLHLTQDYNTIKEKYDALMGRQETATLSGNLEQTGEDTRFQIIDPPRVLETWSAVAGKLLVLTSGVLVVGLAGGLGVAFLLGQLRPVVYERQALNSLTELPVVGTISRTLTPRLLIRKRLELTALGLVGIMMLGTYGSVLFLQLNNLDIAQLSSFEEKAASESSDSTSPAPAKASPIPLS